MCRVSRQVRGNISAEVGGRGAGSCGDSSPIVEVYQEYRREAMNSMDRRVLPPSVQAMVREYFDALGQ